MKKVILVFTILAILSIYILLTNNHYNAIAGASEAKFVPNSKCRMCHLKIFKEFSETTHAKSFESLVDMGEDKNPKCFSCHTTGYGKTGGFTNVQDTADLVGVTCQACHGPGSAHIAGNLNKEQRRELIGKPTGDTCTKCHNIHVSHPDLDNKQLPYLKKKLENLQKEIKKLGG
ncbi:hypothetical protein FJZ33_13015 [Candidatus Poribacteria bacterium]|nr:hypothetical protein [Candidatus Poribacteria bacterium]